MSITQQFIDAKWHTVPMKGSLQRDEQGKKTLPQFEADWKSKYTKQFNTTPAKLAGALTGQASNIIAIDCDNTATYSLFLALDPTYSFHFVSKGKQDKEGNKQHCGTIIYKHTPEVASFQINNDYLALDFYNEQGFIYLPTEYNYTKEPWIHDSLPEVKEAPSSVLALLKTLAQRTVLKDTSTTQPTQVSNRLAPMLEDYLKRKDYSPSLFKIITPKDFRDLPDYIKKGHLHPNDVPQGRGSEYLSKISAILGADISVSVELYINIMKSINTLWSKPMDSKHLMATIVNPMVEKKASIDGNPIWQYDTHWERLGFAGTTLNGDYVESFYDDIKSQYYLINYTVPYIKVFSQKRELISVIKTLMGRAISELQYDTSKQIIRTTLNPSKEFGHIATTDTFNLFRQTPELNVLTNPEIYKNDYKRPETVLKYMETLIPDAFMRNYLLSFIRTKLTTFKYSPIVFYMIGAHGSGKDTLVNILRQILGDDYIAKPDTKVFLEQYNGWIMDKFFIHLDEYGNKLTRATDKQEALGKIKSYSGSDTLQIRAMRQDGFNYHHCMTIIMTANSSPLPLETEDRRIAFVSTPNRLDRMQWVKDAGGISLVIDKLFSEILDFCYYLATEVHNLKGDAYVVAPDTPEKEALIFDSMPAYEQISQFVIKGKINLLEELFIENGIADYWEGWHKNRLSHNKLAELYDTVTEGAGSMNVVTKALKSGGIRRQHTTKGGQNFFYYDIDGLHNYKVEFTNKPTIEGLE